MDAAHTGVKTTEGISKKNEKHSRKRIGRRKVSLSEAEVLKLIHELEVHQIELEIQNEELMQSIAAERDAVDLYDFAPMGYFTLSKTGAITKLNLCGSQLLGEKRSYLLGNRFDAFISDDTKAVFTLFVENLFKSQKKESCEVTLNGRNVRPLFVHLTGIITYNGKQCLITAADITERKRTEAALHNIQRLESLGVLAGGIAHDFNNLMVGIYGYIELASSESDKNVASGYLVNAMATIDRARALTQQLLTFAKGGAPVRKVGKLFPFIKTTAQFALSGSNVSCHFDVPDNLWPCSFDRCQISQVIDNLIINARHAMPDGGSIMLTARNVTLREKEHPLLPEGRYVGISVTDTGVGIPKECLIRIFDPFFTNKPNHHGLGLATCHSIINKHKGCIDVESEPGKGSTFYVYLPAIAELHAATTRTDVAIPDDKGIFVIMDNEEKTRDTFSSILATLGYTVVCKKNGWEVIDYYKEEIRKNSNVSGMILDLSVPQGYMDGNTAIIEIRKLNKNLPVFVTSDAALDPVMLHCEAYGFTASINKPVQSNELIALLGTYAKK